jgi:glucokinase
MFLNGKLYSGHTGGAGEFGMIDYKDHVVEYYASGQFFMNVYKVKGEEVYVRALQSDKDALQMYEEMGMHLGNAIKMILYALDVELIVLGGSASKAFPFFKESMWKSINEFAFQRAVKRLRIEVSELENAGILGAAALHYDR